MANRLADLKRKDGAAPANPYSPGGTRGGGGGTKTPPAVPGATDTTKSAPPPVEGSMEFEVAPIQERLDTLRVMNKELDGLQREYLLEQNKELQQRIDRLVAGIGGVSLETNQLVNSLNAKTQVMRKKGASTTTIRLRNTQFTMLSNQLIELTKATWNNQNKHNTSVKNSVARRLKVRYASDDGKTLTDDEADVMATQLVESNQTDQVFALAREELVRVMRTKEEMAEIEFAMRTLHRIFIDMQLMVEEQSEAVDVIGQNVETAHTNIEKGTAATAGGRKGKGGCIIS